MENGEKFGNASNVDMCLNELEYETGTSSGERYAMDRRFTFQTFSAHRSSMNKVDQSTTDS